MLAGASGPGDDDPVRVCQENPERLDALWLSSYAVAAAVNREQVIIQGKKEACLQTAHTLNESASLFAGHILPPQPVHDDEVDGCVA